MESQIEWRRRAHEEIDRLEASMVDLLLSSSDAGKDSFPVRTRAFKQKLVVEHQLALLLNQMSSTAASLLGKYKNFNETQDSERKFLQIEGADLGPFYSQLKAIKDCHRRQPSSIIIDEFTVNGGAAIVSSSNFASQFSGEECNGRYLDLYESFDEAVNLMTSEDLKSFDYLKFLLIFDQPTAYIPTSKQSSSSYSAYLDHVLAYLRSFMARTQPLSNVLNETAFKLKLEEVNEVFAGDEAKLETSLPPSSKTNPLYCVACERLFSNSAVFEGHLLGKKHLKAAANCKSQDPDDSSFEEAKTKFLEQRRAELEKRREVAIKEAELQLIGEFLKDVKAMTRGNVERRQALTGEERAAAEAESEREDEEAEGANTRDTALEANEVDLDEGLEGRIYNPLKLPLDWDGKPIPYWLWKLHGLGVSFPCEICGNYVYMGRRAFDQHFYEWRHAHGMKCLGIPNTSHFFQITKIEEVKVLWEQMRRAAKSDALHPDMMEECEDSSGNVYDRRTFEDLKRQGLL